MSDTGRHGLFRIHEGDITALKVDAIVNAANTSLLGGGVDDGAIHRAAGPALLAECETLGGCETGGAKITGGHELSARYVIHAVGPVWQGGTENEDALLAGCYSRAVELAQEHAVGSIAFPAISTGVYRFPPDRAALIAVNTIAAMLSSAPALSDVVFCCFGAEAVKAHRQALDQLRAV